MGEAPSERDQFVRSGAHCDGWDGRANVPLVERLTPWNVRRDGGIQRLSRLFNVSPPSDGAPSDRAAGSRIARHGASWGLLVASPLLEVSVNHRDDDGAFADGGGDAFHAVCSDVADGEHSGDAGLEGVRWAGERPSCRFDGFAGDEEAVVVADEFGRQPAGAGLGADEDEQAGRRKAFTCPGAAVGDLNPLQARSPPPSTISTAVRTTIRGLASISRTR